MASVRTWLSVVVLAACGAHANAPGGGAPGPLAAQATAGVSSPALRALLADEWDWEMREAPAWAMTLGDHRFDDRLPARDAASTAAHERDERAFLARARALDGSAMDPRDRVTLDLLVQKLDADVALQVCKSWQWAVSPRSSPLVELTTASEDHPIATVADGRNLIAQLGAGAVLIDDTTANLTAGLDGGRVAQAETIRRVIAQADQELARPSAEWKMAAPAKAAHPGWPPAERARFAADLVDVIEHRLRPALARYRDFLHDRALPAARSGADEGLHALPDGDACYRAHILAELGEARTAEQLHALGLAEIAKSDARIAALGAKALGTADLASTIKRLREDRSLYFHDRAELLAAARADLARAKAAIPRFFGRLPKADAVVTEIPANEAPFTTIAYYDPAHLDGSKPGEFRVNTYQPETRPRYELAALAAHESIPGHHLQVAIAQEQGLLPLFRRTLGTTAFVEGWALYCERLADEMGLYQDDLDRLGAASYDAWRASRLVVDTGIHAMGWTREEAEQFLREHTALTPENITNEVDRYISDPGQALAYKVGQLAILELRARAEHALGKRFDLRRFHDVVLGAGAVTLPVLQRQVDDWIERGGP